MDTIFALSSGAPPAGVAIVRLSGPGVRFGLETLVESMPEPRRATLRTVRGRAGEALDRALVLFFPGPGSFTGEDVGELHLHGGRAVIGAVLRTLGEFPGFRPADQGEFTRRAFMSGRLDLTEVEGLADLIAAETEAQRRQAMRQAEGGFRRLCEGWREQLVRARAYVEADFDFSDEEDVATSDAAGPWRIIRDLERKIAAHLDDGHRGERLREGAEIVLLGAPNAGKSSLINALARRQVAIVAPEPGTTRDLIEVHLDLGGYPVTVVDTAGLRATEGIVEREGVRRAEARAQRADLVLLLTDVAMPMHAIPAGAGVPALRLGTKIDLIDSEQKRAVLGGEFDHLISVKTGEGIDGLLKRLQAFVKDEFEAGEAPLITRERHRSALAACRDSLVAAGQGGMAPELRAEELRRATDALGRITGRVDVEELLDVIFREFCIGK